MNVAQSRARAVTDIFTSPTIIVLVDKDDVPMALTFANGRPNVLPEIDHNNNIIASEASFLVSSMARIFYNM